MAGEHPPHRLHACRRTLVLALGYCGLHFGEAAALTVSSVDVDAGRTGGALDDVRTCANRVSRRADEEQAVRSVPVPAFLYALLK